MLLTENCPQIVKPSYLLGFGLLFQLDDEACV